MRRAASAEPGHFGGQRGIAKAEQERGPGRIGMRQTCRVKRRDKVSVGPRSGVQGLWGIRVLPGVQACSGHVGERVIGSCQQEHDDRGIAVGPKGTVKNGAAVQ